MRTSVALPSLLLMGIARFACAPFDTAPAGQDAGTASGDAASGDAASGPSADGGGPFCSSRLAGTVFCDEFDDVRSLDAGCSPSTGPGRTLVVDAGMLLASVSTDGGGGGAYLEYKFSPTANHVHVEALVRAVRIDDTAVSPLGLTNYESAPSARELALYVDSTKKAYLQYYYQPGPVPTYLPPDLDVSKAHQYAIDLQFEDDGGAPVVAVSVDGTAVLPSKALAASWARNKLAVQVGVTNNAKDSEFEVDNVLITVE